MIFNASKSMILSIDGRYNRPCAHVKVGNNAILYVNKIKVSRYLQLCIQDF